MTEMNDIARRLAELRESCGLCTKQAASRLGLPEELYLGYESGSSDIPISVIYRMAGLCGVDLADIMTGTSAKLDTYHIVRRGGGRSVDRYPGYSFSDLAFRYGSKLMHPLLVTLEPSDKPAALVTHEGQEFNYVLFGAIILTFDGRELLLEEGDSIYFNPLRHHGQRCAGEQRAVFLTVITQ